MLYKYIPEWVAIVVVLGLAIALIVSILRGGTFSFKGVKIDTTKPHYEPKKDAVNSSHLVKFRKLQQKIKSDIIVTKSEIFAMYRSLFINYLKDLGFEHKGIELNKNVIEYERILKNALIEEFHPLAKQKIFGNHFPVKGEEGHEKESEKEYDHRFFEDFSKPAILTILKITRNHISTNWKMDLNRSDYEENYVMGETALNEILNKMSFLIVKCRENRDDDFKCLCALDGTTVEALKLEWEIVWG